MQLLAVCIGWLLGFGSSFILRWYDREQKINEFKKGLKAELQEILPILTSNILILKETLGNLDYDFLKWFKSIISFCPGGLIDIQDNILDILLSLPPDQVASLIQARKLLQETGRGKNLKRYYLKYYENNISTASLIRVDLQRSLFKIHGKMQTINQEVDRYYFYFDKTFDPASKDVNADILNINMNLCYKTISDALFDAINEIVKLLSILETETSNGYLYRLKNLSNQLKLAIEKRGISPGGKKP